MRKLSPAVSTGPTGDVSALTFRRAYLGSVMTCDIRTNAGISLTAAFATGVIGFSVKAAQQACFRTPTATAGAPGQQPLGLFAASLVLWRRFEGGCD